MVQLSNLLFAASSVTADISGANLSTYKSS
jgi:hypothetical protein